jgi:hypothetical protein
MLVTLRRVIEAHGGLENWNKHKALSVDLVVGGMLWGLKGQAGKLERTNVTVGLGEGWASHHPFEPDNRRTRFSPDRVAIEDAQGKVLEELAAPRASFAGHALETPWTEPQVAYFAGYAMWTYLNLPFLVLHEGVEVEELPIWRENSEAWRPLRLTFPDTIATHSKVQTIYAGEDGLLRRHDYTVEITGRLARCALPGQIRHGRWHQVSDGAPRLRCRSGRQAHSGHHDGQRRPFQLSLRIRHPHRRTAGHSRHFGTKRLRPLEFAQTDT